MITTSHGGLRKFGYEAGKLSPHIGTSRGGLRKLAKYPLPHRCVETNRCIP